MAVVATQAIEKLQAQWAKEAKAKTKQNRITLMRVMIPFFLIMHLVIIPGVLWLLIEGSDSFWVMLRVFWIGMPPLFLIFTILPWISGKMSPMTIEKFDWWAKYDTGDVLIDDAVEKTLEHFANGLLTKVEDQILTNLIVASNKDILFGVPVSERKNNFAQSLYETVQNRWNLPPKLTETEPMF